MCRKVDNYYAYAATAALTLARLFVGYNNVTAYLVVTALVSIPMGMTTTLTYMFTPDCAEYGRYKTGISVPGIMFSVQTFFAKLQSAIVTVIGSLMLAMIGFVESENAVQAAGFAGRLWNASIIAPVIGIVLGLIILRAYKLNDHDVELIAKCNAGEISYAEAEA